jgi:hypothetical protein
LAGCVNCHATIQNAGATFVQDNSGVRAVTGEFTKWSHHVTGVTANDGHCAACHLEGKTSADGLTVVVDTTKHMVDASIHLRNADDDSEYVWTPNTPNFTNMDNFCMSCHDSDGATSTESGKIQTWLNADASRKAAGKTANAGNPFGDTISNGYDLEERPQVVDASGQFATGNNSHHAVKGKKYSGRTRGDGVAARTVETVAFASNSSAAMPGVRKTIFDAGKFEAAYVTLGNATAETPSVTAVRLLATTLPCTAATATLSASSQHRAA